MADIKNIILNTSAEALEDMIAPFIEEQFPTFIRTDYRKLVLFIKAYYEWMDSQGQPGYVLGKLDTVSDVDRNVEEFFSHFKNTYLLSFPELLATDSLGNKPNKKTLLKKIRDFYGNKGTENSYKFLFRVLYDSDLEIYYPKTDILKSSDGQWIEPVSVKTTSANAANLFSMKNGTIAQYDSAENLIASATIDSVVQYSFNGLPITEFFIKDINGDFLPNRETVLSKDSVSYTETSYSVLGEFFVELQGEGYQVGDIVSVVGANGVGFVARIEQTGLAGSVKKIGIINSGINYEADVIATIVSNTGNAQAKVIVKRSSVTRYPGYFSGNRGKVSSNKFVQDGNYYQEFSYELKSAVSLDTYFDVLKRIVHPAGMRMFGSVLVKQAIDNTVSSSSQQTTFEVPVIGRYTPYALRTFNDLRGGYFLPNQVKGATLQVWLSGYNIAGNTSSGITAGWGVLPDAFSIGSDPGGRSADREDIFGVQHWRSIVGGHTFSHPSLYPNSNVWLTPNFQQESLNTHPTVRIRPVQYNFNGPAYGSALVSLGFSGPTMGALGITRDRSFFTVVKPGRVSTATTWDGSAQAYVLSNSVERHGVWFGVTGGTVCVATFNRSASSVYSGVTAPIGGTGSWKLVSTAYSIGAGSSGPLSLFVNGVCYGTASSSAVDLAQLNVSNTLIGMRASSSFAGAFDGEIAEILAYQGALSDGDRQKVEGYLAHKYNLDGNLPQGHPYKTTPPGASLPAGGWSGATGDFYPRGYNPYIGSTTEIGPNGSTAAAGSLFFRSGLGYTYTVVDEFGLTAHNPVGAPLGSTYAWFNSKENSPSPEGMRGLVLWLKPENIGVCGSVANGASADVWTDASPSANHALPPTWDKWNGVAHITHTANTTTGWTRQVYDNTNPVTKIAFVFNGLCGGFTQGRLCMVGLNPASAVTIAGYIPGNWVYSRGPFSSDPTTPRRIYYINYDASGNNETVTEISPTLDGYDNSVFEMEYVEPNLIWRKDGVVKRQRFVGYGQTFYMDSTFYLETPDASRTGHSVTITELSYNGNPVTPTFTASSGIDVRTYRGVTVDKLRPTLQTAGFGGATGVSFNGGIVFAPASVYAGVTLGGVVGLGYTTGLGSSAAAVLTGQHLYLKRPLKVTDDADIFVVYRTTREGLSFGYGLLGSRNTNCDLSANPSVRFDSVLFSRSYNEQDRTAAQQTSSYYSVLPNGTLMYPGASLPPAGLAGFRPYGDATGVVQNFIAYDPHLSGVCLGICIAEARRDSTNKIEVFVNGDAATNSSRATNRKIVGLDAPQSEDYIITRGLEIHYDAGKTACVGEMIAGQNSNLARNVRFPTIPTNVLGPLTAEMWEQESTLVTQNLPAGVPLPPAPFDIDEIYRITTGPESNFFLNRGAAFDTQPGAAAWDSLYTNTVSTAWTAVFFVRRDDGAAITASVYLHNNIDGYYAVPGTVTDVGGGWYRISGSITGKSNTANPDGVRVYLTGLSITDGANKTFYVSGVQLLPFDRGNANGTVLITDTTHTQTGGAQDISRRYGTANANRVQRMANPWDDAELVWRAVNHSTNRAEAAYNANGGFYTAYFPVDRTKLYRFSVWVNRVAATETGTVYFGPQLSSGSVTTKSTGAANTNPYFATPGPIDAAFVGKTNTWVLVAGHIHPNGTATGAQHPNSGWYTRTGGGNTYAPITEDFIWGSDATDSLLRTFLYGSDIAGTEIRFVRPRIDLVDGSEPSIEDLLNNTPETIYDLSGKGRNGFAVSKPLYTASSGGFWQFDGRNSVITTGTVQEWGSSGNHTWEAWLYNPNGTSDPLVLAGVGIRMYAGTGDTVGSPFFVYPTSTSDHFSYNIPIGGTRVGAGLGTTISFSRWNHLVVVTQYLPNTNTSEVKIYLNGVLVKTNTFSGKSNAFGNRIVLGNRANTTLLTINLGYNSSGGSYFYNGGISSFRSYSRDLSSQEVLQNFNSTRSRFGV